MAQTNQEFGKLIISIVNHNSVEPLRTCLESVFANVDGMICDIYVVDNLCEEQAADMLKEEFPLVKVIVNSQTLGFGANHNQILKLAVNHSDYVLVLNPDTVLPPNAIQTMTKFLASIDSVAVCSPRLVGTDGPLKMSKQVIKLYRDALLMALYISNAKNLLTWYDKLVSWKSYGAVSKKIAHSAIEDPLISKPKVEFCQTILGACMLFRTDALQDVGLFDERFFLYFEETDWCLRAHQRGWEVCLLNNIKVTHYRGYSTTRLNYLKYFAIIIESWLLFYRKYQGVFSEYILKVWLTFVATLNIVRWSILFVIQPDKRDEFVTWRLFSTKLIKRIWQKGG